MIAKEGVDVMYDERGRSKRKKHIINKCLGGGNIAYPSMKVVKISASSSALRKASCMMDSPTETRIRPDGDMRNGWEGNRKPNLCGLRRTSVPLAHEMQMHGWRKRKFGRENQNGLPKNGDDEEGDGDDRRCVRDGGDADDKGGIHAY
jgi:hypothetical protein